MKSFSIFLGSLSILLISGLAAPDLRAATITVTETADSFDNTGCSLREAIQEMNTNGGYSSGCTETGPFGSDDTIVLTAQTYVLSVSGGVGEDDNAFGDLDVHVSLNITGAGSTQTAISASGFAQADLDRVMHIVELVNGTGGFTPSITVNISGLTIRDGDTETNSSGGGGGLAINFSQALVNLDDVTFDNNRCSGDGGGVANSNAVLVVDNSFFTGNSATSDAGALNNNTSGTTVVLNTTMEENFSPDDGGAIQNFGTMMVVNSTINNNTCVEEESEAIIAGPVFLQGDGGGISVGGGIFLMINSTVSNNEAGNRGGGIDVIGPSTNGDGPPASVALFNTTVAQNSVLSTGGFGGGICHNCEIQPQGLTSEVQLANSLIAENQAANFPDCAGDFASSGYNLATDDSGCNGLTATGDQTNVAAGIGPLQNNGGPTETHALLEGSLAIDRATPPGDGGCEAPNVQDFINSGGTIFLEVLTEDQRGLTRPVAVLDPAVAVCDIGAYEFQIAEPTPTPTATPLPPPGAQLLEGSGCSLNPFSAASSGAGLWLALGTIAGICGFRRRKSGE